MRRFKYPHALVSVFSLLILAACGSGSNSNPPNPSPSPSPSATPLATPSPTPSPDADLDGIFDESDNCRDVVNPSQGDGNGNGIGDACDLPTAQFYEAVTPGSLKILKLDQVTLPTRLKISPDGKLMFVSELSGRVHVYDRVNDSWVRQSTPFMQVNLGGLDISQERGMTGLFFGVDFDAHSSDPLRRDLFVTYQFLDGSDFVNRISRVTVSRSGNLWVAENADMIYQGPNPLNQSYPIGAHQIQDGFSLEYEGLPHLLVSIGDGFLPANATDESFESLGKILLMQRDGSSAAGTRPFANPYIQGKGIRNVFSMLLLPEELDSRRRVLGFENGSDFQDRIWLLELIDFGHETDEAINLGWNGNDQATSWTSIPDLNTPGAFSTQGVLRLISPTVAPTSAALHPGKGIIAPPPGQVGFVVTLFGPTFCTSNCQGKNIMAGSVGNFGNQPGIDNFFPIVRRSAFEPDQLSNPIALDVDPLSGDLFFADIVNGEIDRVVIFP